MLLFDVNLETDIRTEGSHKASTERREGSGGYNVAVRVLRGEDLRRGSSLEAGALGGENLK
jgi:hypothetical protein